AGWREGWVRGESAGVQPRHRDVSLPKVLAEVVANIVAARVAGDRRRLNVLGDPVQVSRQKEANHVALGNRIAVLGVASRRKVYVDLVMEFCDALMLDFNRIRRVLEARSAGFTACWIIRRELVDEAGPYHLVDDRRELVHEIVDDQATEGGSS